MSDITEVSSFNSTVNLIDTDELATHDLFNSAAQSLANRTRYLYDVMLRLGSMKIPVKCATTGSTITRSGVGQSIDGLTVADGDSVLVKDQNSSVQNGIFIVSEGSWQRRFDSDTSAEMNSALVTVTHGTQNARTIWQQQTQSPIVDTQNIVWKQIYPHSFNDLTDQKTTIAGYGITDMHLYSPPGAVTAFAGSLVPDGWLECNGASKQRADYPALFGAIGVTYGSTDDTHFNIPDLRGEFIRGWDNNRHIDDGRVVGSAQADAFESHIHQTATQSGTAGPNAGDTFLVNTIMTDAHGAKYSLATGDTETRPRNIAMMYIIKY